MSIQMSLNLRAIVFASVGNNFFILVSPNIWPGFLDSTWVQSSKHALRPEESSSSNIMPQVLLRDRFYLVTALTCLTVLGLAAMEWRSAKRQQQKIKGSEEKQSDERSP